MSRARITRGVTGPGGGRRVYQSTATRTDRQTHTHIYRQHVAAAAGGTGGCDASPTDEALVSKV